LGLPIDRDSQLAGHVYDALEDETAEPLRAVEDEAGEVFDGFSEMEMSLSEWSFGYGIAWALARTREPFASSRRVSELAEAAVVTAWRSFGEQPWRALIADDRAHRPAPEPEVAPRAEHAEHAGEAAETADPGAAEEPEEEPLDEFMGGLARARSRRPRDRSGQPEAPGDA
jgi:hypothetical protein